MDKNISFTLKVWRQRGPKEKGAFATYQMKDIPGEADTLNVELEKALRLLDFIEIGRLMAYDALNREESCGGHFREEHQTEEGEAKRDDENFSYVACWKYTGDGQEPELIKEDLNYQYIKVQQRNYKN